MGMNSIYVPLPAATGFGTETERQQGEITLRNCRRDVVLGAPGAGRTMLLRHSVLAWAGERYRPRSAPCRTWYDPRRRHPVALGVCTDIPVLLPLHSVSPSTTFPTPVPGSNAHWRTAGLRCTSTALTRCQRRSAPGSFTRYGASDPTSGDFNSTSRAICGKSCEAGGTASSRSTPPTGPQDHPVAGFWRIWVMPGVRGKEMTLSLETISRGLFRGRPARSCGASAGDAPGRDGDRRSGDQ